MDKMSVVQKILAGAEPLPKREYGEYYAPSNIALCKYWGKRDAELNLPFTSSFSISLGSFGARTQIKLIDTKQDHIFINQEQVHLNSHFAVQLIPFLDLFRFNLDLHYKVMSEINIPVGAGLASSACGYAALVGALNHLYEWELPKDKLSLLARLGSGSACRSFWQGFVEWQQGTAEDGMDSMGKPYPEMWPALRIGLLILNSNVKHISSRIAMKNTVLTSSFYASWPSKHALDTARLKKAIQERDFVAFGETAESNALAMHALMLTGTPPILYSEPETIRVMHDIWRYRQQGLPLYFTQDAGPNLKLLFLEQDQETVQQLFPALKIIAPFATINAEVMT